MKFTSLPRAFVRETTKRINHNFSLDDFVKTRLRKLSVAFYDACCDSEGTTKPVRFNEATPGLEYFDGTDWVAVPTAP